MSLARLQSEIAKGNEIPGGRIYVWLTDGRSLEFREIRGRRVLLADTAGRIIRVFPKYITTVRH